MDDVTNNDVLGFYSRLSPIMTTFYNVSIETQGVISDWKLLKVTPIYMGKGSNDDAGNYTYMSDRPYHEHIREYEHYPTQN